MDDDAPSPFDGMPFFGDLGKLFSGMGGGDTWETARRIAIQMATGGVGEANVDPARRMEIEQLARVAELQIARHTGLDAAAATITPVTRGVWADTTVRHHRALFERLAGSLGTGMTPDDDMAGSDPMAAMLGQMMQMIGPMMLSMTAGSMVGHLASRSLGQYDVPIPRPGVTEIMVVPANIETFAEEWSLPLQDLLLWICLHELCHHTVLSVPHVGVRLEQLLLDYAGGFRPDPSAIESRFGNLDISSPDALADLQSTLGDPEVLLGAIQSPEQQAMLPQLHALTAAIVGYVDHTMAEVGTGLIGSFTQLTEALHRRRVEADPSDRFIARLLGLELTQEVYDRGRAFADGVVDRAGAEGLNRLWESEEHFPTPSEIDAPGLWLARIDL